MNKLMAIGLGAAAIGVSLAGDVAAEEMFVASLDGAQEPGGGVVTDATGTATLTLNDTEDALEIHVRVFGLDVDGSLTPGDDQDNVLAMHIHAAPRGTNGGVVFGFISPNSDTNGQLVITPEVDGFSLTSIWDGNEGNNTTLADQLDNLRNEGLYFNVHTVANGGGEIRGQIEVPEPTSIALLLASGGLTLARGRRRA